MVVLAKPTINDLRRAYYAASLGLPLNDSGTVNDLEYQFLTLFSEGVRVKAYTTLLRPLATSVSNGFSIYDSDLDKPLWSNGLVWKDSGGVAV